MKRGDRVKLSDYGLATLYAGREDLPFMGNRRTERRPRTIRGTVIGFGRTGDTVRVRWDQLSPTSHTSYHKDFIEVVAE